MSSDKICAFIDESGNTSLNFDSAGTSSHYILAAVIVSENDKLKLEQEVENFRKKHFQTGEIKSSGIKAANNHKRRIKLLKELGEIEFTYYIFIINKKMIWETSGLRNKKSFLKYLTGKLYTELNISYPKLSIYADEHGSSDFMKEFRIYVDKNHPRTLFSDSEGLSFDFQFRNSKDCILIQLADLIVGTISFGYEENKNTPEYDIFFNNIREKEIGRKEWPIKYEKLECELDKNNVDEYDEIIAKTSIRIATDYLNKNRSNYDIESREKVITIEYLLRQLDINYGKLYTTSSVLIEYINERLDISRENRYFKSEIIAKLRDEGILLSSSNKGYKIPLSKNDIYKFVSRTNTVISPMLSRLDKARRRIKLATQGKFDILDKEEYAKLREFLDKR